MFNATYIHRMMKKTVEVYGFETIEKPDKRVYPEVRGIHDEHTLFLATKEQSSEMGEESFIVFTFRELLLYKRKDFRERCIEIVRYRNIEEVYDFLHRYAKVKDHWYEQLFQTVKVHLSEHYPTFIKKENEKLIELALPYNHTVSNAQSLFVYPTQFSLQIFRGSPYTGKWDIVSNHDYRNMPEFLEVLASFYTPQTIWTEE